MATPLAIEEESGTITRTPHLHNGYCAGDFSGLPARRVGWTTFPTGPRRHFAVWIPED